MSNNLLYKNFLLNRINETIPTLESVGSGVNLVNEKNGPNLKIKSIKNGPNIVINENNDHITITALGGGTGNITGPLTSTINAVCRFDINTGVLVKDSPNTIIDDLGNISTLSLNTGQGNNLLYGMDQNVKTTDSVEFNEIITSNLSSTFILVDDINSTNSTISMNKTTEFDNGFIINNGVADFTNVTSVIGLNAGDVDGPASSTDDALVRFDGTTGKLIQNSNATLTDAGLLTIDSLSSTSSLISNTSNDFTNSTVDFTNATINGVDFVDGPASSTDDALVRFDGTTGKLIQNSNATLTDAGLLTIDSLSSTSSLISNTSNDFTNSTVDFTNATINGVDFVDGPASSTDDALVRFDGTTGKLIQNSNATLTDAGLLTIDSLSSTSSLISNTSNDFTNSTVDFTNATINGVDFVDGPASSTDDALVRFDGTTGKLIQNSNATLTDAGLLTIDSLSSTSSLISNTSNDFTNSTVDFTNATINGVDFVDGPASSTDDALVRFDGTTGKLIQNSNATLTDAGLLTIDSLSSTSSLISNTSNDFTNSTVDFTNATINGVDFVDGPASSTDDALVRFDGTTGKLIQNSNATLTDAGLLTIDSLSSTSSLISNTSNDFTNSTVDFTNATINGVDFVDGPASSTDDALVRFDGTTGKLIQNSNATLTDAGLLTIDSLSSTSSLISNTSNDFTNSTVDFTNATINGVDFVDGPASSTDDALVRFDGTTGKLIQNSNATLTDAGLLTIDSLSSTSSLISNTSNDFTNSTVDFTNATINGVDFVDGPASSTDDALVRFDGTTGKLIQNSNATLTDAGLLTIDSLSSTSSLISNTSNDFTNSTVDFTNATINGVDFVDGPASSTDDALVRFDGTTGKLIQNSNATLTDAGLLTVDNITINNAQLDTSITKILVLDASNEIKYVNYQKIYGSIYFINNTSITSLTQNVWSDINTSGYNISSIFSNILPTSPTLELIKLSSSIDDFHGIVLCNIVLENIASANRTFQVGIFLNGVLVDGTQMSNEINRRMNEVTTHSLLLLSANDEIKIRVRNLTNNDNCRVTNINFTVLKINSLI